MFVGSWEEPVLDETGRQCSRCLPILYHLSTNPIFVSLLLLILQADSPAGGRYYIRKFVVHHPVRKTKVDWISEHCPQMSQYHCLFLRLYPQEWVPELVLAVLLDKTRLSLWYCQQSKFYQFITPSI